MLASALLTVLALTAQQSGDPSRGAREAYTSCLRQFMNRSVEQRMAESAFTEALPQQCADQERAFRQAITSRETGFRTPAAEIEQIATDEINDARTNIRETFAMHSTPR